MSAPAEPRQSRVVNFAELFMPKLLTVMREGYGLPQLRADAVAGLTVAIVALPLSMAIAIASGGAPAQGLYTAIVGGFLVSALGGSRFQIGGPAGAFIVLVATTVATHGMSGLILATFLSGAIMIILGFARLGTFIKFIPFPVTVGFTAGIAVIIFASQLKDLLGLTLAEGDPGPLVEKIPALWAAMETFTPAAVAISVATVGIIAGLKYARPHWPGMLIAVVAAAGVTAAFGLPIATIGSNFGGIPSVIPAPALPELSFAKVLDVLPAAVSFALLGAIESLLSAVVADGMSGGRHRSNCELVAQGAANMASALFGGFCVTGTIARTATNVRAGAHGPVAGMLHAVFLLLFMLLAAPLAAYTPLAALAGVLMIVAWDMVERPAIAVLLRAGWGDAAVLAATFFLTVFRDLTEAIVVGFALGSVLFIHRMSEATEVVTHKAFVGEDAADEEQGYDKVRAADPEVVTYRISGAFFFGAAASIGSVLDCISDTYKALIIDFSAVPFLDSTGANVMEGLAHKTRRRGVALYISGTNPDIRRALFTHGVQPPQVAFVATIDDAMARYDEARPNLPKKRTEPPATT